MVILTLGACTINDGKSISGYDTVSISPLIVNTLVDVCDIYSARSDLNIANFDWGELRLASEGLQPQTSRLDWLCSEIRKASFRSSDHLVGCYLHVE